MKINSAKFLSVLAVVMLAVSPVLAATNVISSIVVSKSKDKPDYYELNIDSSATSQYKTGVEADGSVYFDLKNATLANNAYPVYDDVLDIENVSVKQLEKSKVRIYVKGKNAKNTDVIFVNSLFEPQVPKKIIINKPINKYKSTSYDDLENQESIQDWDDNSFNFSYLLLSMIQSFKDGTGGAMSLILFMLVVFVIAFKKIASKITSDQTPLIELDTEFAGTNRILTRREALKSAQDELSRAHQKYQDYIQNKYSSVVNTDSNSKEDSLKRSIALSQYQNSNKNPYIDQEVLRVKKDFPNNVTSSSTHIPARPKAAPHQRTMTFKSPYIQRNENKKENETANNSPVSKPYQKPDNLKFLESVTKIYEQSGRGEVASGLKNSITRAKQTL